MRIIKYIMISIIMIIMAIQMTTPCYAISFDVETTYQSIFVITAKNSIGSGFAIGKNIILTNAHVVESQDVVDIIGYDGKSYLGMVYAVDKGKDIAIIATENSLFAPLHLAEVDRIKVGEDVYAIGAPKSLSYTLTKGVVSNNNRIINGEQFIQIDAAINSGNSGGPLLDSNGSVVGMNTLKLNDAEGIGLAIPVSIIREYLQSLGIVDEIIIDNTRKIASESVNEEQDIENKDKEELEKKSMNRNTVILLSVLLGISVMCNVFFIIVLMYKKNKDIIVVKDTIVDNDISERTDFEIELLN